VTTTYRLVGHQSGDLRMIWRMKVGWERILGALCCLLLLVVGILAFLMLNSGTSTTTPPDAPLRAVLQTNPATTMTTTMTTATTTTTTEETWAVPPMPNRILDIILPAVGECTFWGDPHFKTFDGGRPSFYGEGELYIVKSDRVAIQSRYKSTLFTKGLAATNKIAVGGNFINGHVIEVGCLEDGDITVDGRAVLAGFPATYSFPDVEGARIDYTSEGRLVDQATGVFSDRHIVHMDLPLGVRLTVLRWVNYVDFRLRMPRQRGQDGGCGNFNGDPADDTTEAIFERDGARVQDVDLLFRRRTDVSVGEGQKKLLATCPEAQMEKAKRECVQELSGTRGASMDIVQLQSCYLDICFGANEKAPEMLVAMGM